MSDIVERLLHCSENCGDEYLHELTGKAADTIIRLRADIISYKIGNKDLQDHCAEITNLTAEVAEYDAMFDAAWEADMRGVQMWREAHPGNDMVLPDRKRFTAWILAEIIRLRSLTVIQESLIRKEEAENEKLRAALEKAKGGFYNMANAIDDYDYHGPAPQCTGDIIGHREQFHRVHVEQLVKYAEECRAVLSGKESLIRGSD